MAKNRIKNPNITNMGRIKTPQNIDCIRYDDYCPAFSFSYVQKDYCLSKCSSNDIRKLIEKLATLETKNWSEIKSKHIFQFKIVNRNGLKVSIPNVITPDVNIQYFKPFGQNTSFRVFGIKERHNFKFLWFDKNHEIYPG